MFNKVIFWLSSLWKFSRPHTIIGTSLSVFSLYFLTIATTDIQITEGNFILMIGAWISCLLGNLYIVGLNQIIDVDIDKINKPNLPLASGNFSLKQGQWIVCVSGLIAFISSGLLGWWLFLTVVISLIIGTAYSLPPIRIKRFPLLAAFCIFTVRGFIVNLGLFLHFSQQLTGERFLNSSVLLLSLFIIIFTIAIALFKDVPDTEGDKKYQINTFTILVGKTRIFNITRWTITISYLTLIIGTFLFDSVIHYWFLLISHVVLLILLWIRSRKVNLDIKSEITSFYQFIWKLFFLEYLLFSTAYFI